MTCHCCRNTCKRFGKHRNGLQRYRCNQCSKTFTEEHERPLDDMRLPLDSIRMGMRRMTRLTNAFSKKWENLEAAYNLWFAYYNFCRIHKALQLTPAMNSGLAGHPWSIAELLS